MNHTLKVRILYKTILRLHRGLPPEMQELGTTYAKDEFRRHKSCTPEQQEIFMEEWTRYTVTLAKQLGYNYKTGIIGKDLSEADLSKLNEQQINQLYQILVSSTGITNK